MAKKFQLAILETQKPQKLSANDRKAPKTRLAQPTTKPRDVFKALKATPGADKLLIKIPELENYDFWRLIASFRACQKTGSALWLDLWDADHFDHFTDMQKCLTDCHVWFSDNAFPVWGSPDTRVGRINCFFQAPADGLYICNANLQSYGGNAVVECRIDSSSFGNLQVNGSITQPHTCNLTAGIHCFRISQVSGSFFFTGLTVWRV